MACPSARSQQELLAETRLPAQGSPPGTADGRAATRQPCAAAGPCAPGRRELLAAAAVLLAAAATPRPAAADAAAVALEGNAAAVEGKPATGEAASITAEPGPTAPEDATARPCGGAPPGAGWAGACLQWLPHRRGGGPGRARA
jgi:hypothetical protein